MKIIPALTGPMSGKLGGMVASRNRGGQYFRRKAVPVNPDSNRQTAVRSNFATLISLYNNDLTTAQRQSWIQWAANTPRIDSLGQTHVLTGQNAFVGSNSLRLLAGLPLVREITGPYNRGEASSVATAEFANLPPVSVDLTMNFSAPASDEGDSLIFFGRPQNSSVDFYKGPWRFTQVLAFSTNTPSTGITIEDNAWPFIIPENTRLPIKIVNIFDDGRYTDAFSGLFDLGAIPPP